MANDFFIGWQEDPKDKLPKKSRQMVWLLWVLVPAFAIAFVLHQHGFKGSVFEFGKQTEMEGVISLEPVPSSDLR